MASVKQTMRSRVLGRTKISVSEIGFGGWGIGKTMWGPSDDSESMRALHSAVDQGITYFDTAFAYGHGHSEKLIAKLFKEIGRRLTVSTKIPPKNMEWPARSSTSLAMAFPPDWIVSCVERSLRNLATERLTLEQFHVWTDVWLKDPLWPRVVETFVNLKKQGKVQFVGVSAGDDPETVRGLVESGFADQVQVLFNLFDQRAAEVLFPLCKEKGVAVVVRCPFDEGSLTGELKPDTRFPPEDFRGHYFGGLRLKETCERLSALEKDVVGDKAPNLATAALKFALSFDAVSTVIPGMRKSSHVVKNVLASDGRYYDAEEIARLFKHKWVRNFYA